MKAALTIIGALLAGGLVAVVLVFSSQTGALRAQVRAQDAEMQHLSQRETSLSGQVSSINIPTDPLSAYDQICNSQATNDESGVAQTYYYPCTNDAETIPEPGN